MDDLANNGTIVYYKITLPSRFGFVFFFPKQSGQIFSSKVFHQPFSAAMGKEQFSTIMSLMLCHRHRAQFGVI